MHRTTPLVHTAILVSIVHKTLTMTRRERLLFKVLNADHLRNSLKGQAAIVIQQTWRTFKRMKLTRKWKNGQENGKFEDITVTTSTDMPDPTLSNLNLKSNQIIYDQKILNAVVHFRKLRVKNIDN